MTTLKANATHSRQVYIWLLFCAGMIFCMIVLGGVTRLTHSGLSMVEWKPLMGIIPPLSDQDWQDSFQKYQLFPEYQKVNKGMSIEEYKYIFMYEYLHRILGGFQGLLGWYMVKSGLINNPSVSQYRLTAHLGNAVVIYSYILWVAFGLMGERKASFIRSVSDIGKLLRVSAYTITALLFLMILSGGFVAGTRAGLAYSTFPLMGETFVPSGLYSMMPFWLAAFEDVTTIQFNHRILAYVLFVIVCSFSINALYRLKSIELRAGVVCMAVLLIAQICLGIATILMHVPVVFAAAHQATAVALLTASLFLSRSFCDIKKILQTTG